MTFVLLSLALPLFAGSLAFLLRQRPAIGGALATLTGIACLVMSSQVTAGTGRTLTLPLDLTLQWEPFERLMALTLWLVLTLFGLLELVKPGQSFVLPSTLIATGLVAASLVLLPLSLAILAIQIASLLLVFPSLQGASRRVWGSLGYLSLTIVAGAVAQIALGLADFYVLNPDATTARVTAMLFAVTAGLTLALVPLHFWLPRLTESSPHQVTAWVGIVGQLAILGLLVRLLNNYDWLLTVTPVIQTLVIGGLISLVAGGLLALVAPSPRYWLAYCMIGNLGLAAIGVGLFTREGFDGAALTLFARTLGLLLTTAGMRAAPSQPTRWQDLQGLARLRPWSALALGLAGLIFAGLPLLPGFPGAWLTYRAAYAAAPQLAFLMLPGSLLLGLSVLRLLTLLFRPVEPEQAAKPIPRALAALIAGLSLAGLVVTIAPQLILAPLSAALATLRFLP